MTTKDLELIATAIRSGYAQSTCFEGEGLAIVAAIIATLKADCPDFDEAKFRQYCGPVAEDIS